jgi:hypothetical protein
MKKRVRVSVTQRDIESGVPNCDNGCPVWRAVTRATDLFSLSVTVNGVWQTQFRDGEIFSYPLLYRLPVSARRFISRFDKLKPVKPLTFTMRAVTDETV